MNGSMATREFYPVPDIDLSTAEEEDFASCINSRRSTEKAAWGDKQLEDLARKRPEELPPCFLAVQAGPLSLRKGWQTEHGKWVTKESVVDPYRLWSLLESTLPSSSCLWMRSTLVFHPSGGGKSDLVMILFNTVCSNGIEAQLNLNEDITLCRVFRVPERKGKGKLVTVVPVADLGICRSLGTLQGVAADPVVEVPASDTCNVSQHLNLEDTPTGIGGCHLPSNNSFAAPRKRQRSAVWQSFTKIYTKDPKFVYAACHYCGRMFMVENGSTSSMWKHNDTCQCKPGNPMGSLIEAMVE